MSIELIDDIGAAPSNDTFQNKEGDDSQVPLMTPGPGDTVAVDGLLATDSYASLPSEDVESVLSSGYAAQRRLQSYFLACPAEETVLLVIPAGHVTQDSRRELLGIGAWDTIGTYRMNSGALVDNFLDPVAMRRLFGHEEEAINSGIDR
jgi:hypothetical protein